MSGRESMAAYPLAWPLGWKRTPPAQRTNAQFGKRTIEPGRTWASKKWLTVSDGTTRILEQLTRMGVDCQDVIISTNVRLRLDGLPRSGESEPADPGSAIYWKKPGDPMRSMAIDRYTTVADNLAALAATLEAMRAIERHGGAEILDRTFSGFKRLNAETEENWWDVLQVRPDASLDAIQVSYRHLLKTRHPDAGGTHEAMTALNRARDQAIRAKGVA